MSATVSPLDTSSRLLSRMLYVLMLLLAALSTAAWMASHSLNRRDLRLAEERVALASDAGLSAEGRATLQGRTNRDQTAIERAHFWMGLAESGTPVLVFGTIFAVVLLKRDAGRQVRRRQAVESQLRMEQSQLERRVETRTAELAWEVTERKRAEQLNRGRTQLLEMLVREEPPQVLFEKLVEVIANHRSGWGCTLHLARGGELLLAAHRGLPARLVRGVEHVPVNVWEPLARRERLAKTAYVIEDLSRHPAAWPRLLHAHGVQSLWSTAIVAHDQPSGDRLAGEGRVLGTLTTYSLLRAAAPQADLELLEAHSKLAALVLERYRMQDELKQQAFTDSLTHLPNRLLGKQQLSSAVARARRSNSEVAVLWVDLNGFKQTNDTHGHPAGDAMLCEVAQRLRRRLRESDLVARMGGDEFMVVLESVAGREAAKSVAGELLNTISAPIHFNDVALTATASIGIAVYPGDGDTADVLERNADMAMYEAKFNGHGIRSYSAAIEETRKERRELEAAMACALEHDGFMLHYQPQYDAALELRGMEALLRFEHPTMGMVSPTRLIPTAEESQMIVALGKWVLREACRQRQQWHEQGFPAVPVAVNISAMQFVLEDFALQVADVLEATGLRADLLELELTESVMVQDFEETSRQLERLKKLGVRIALDDFGTGYSSLSRLHRLPIDKLKIDRSFINEIEARNGTLPIVESIIGMAQSMHIEVVAEGVETRQQMEVLNRNGCDLLQGYLLSAPVPARQIPALLRAQPVDALQCREAIVSPTLPSLC